MRNKLVLRKSLLAFLAIMTVSGGAGLWWPTSASPAGIAAAPRPFVPRPMPQQVITQANEDARRYQAVPPPPAAAPGGVLNALPDDATPLTIGGATYYLAGGNYYRPVYQGSQVVYQAVANPYMP